MKIKEIAYSETLKVPGEKRFSSDSKTVSVKADLHENEDPSQALDLLKKFVRAELNK